MLANRHVDQHLINLVKDLYDGCEGEVVVQGSKSQPFPMRTGVRQGCALSPMLFNVYIDHIARTALDTPDMAALGYPFAYNIDGQLHPPLRVSAHASTVTPGRITFLMYADDIVLLSDSLEGLTTMMQRMESVSTDWAMTLNYVKTQAMVFHPYIPPTPPPHHHHCHPNYHNVLITATSPHFTRPRVHRVCGILLLPRQCARRRRNHGRRA